MSAPSRPDLVGKTLMGKLRVERALGAGGMGTVYEVEHLFTRHRRALKVLHAQHGQSHETVARFIREAGVAGTLRTPYVVETYDAGTLEDGAAYVLMELLRGQSVALLLDGAHGRLPAGRVAGIACQVLEGLAVAHDAGIVHRDIKPDNLFLVQDDQGRERVKILDFGISKFVHGVQDYAGTLTNEGTMLGTPYYMSPEQASGAKDVDPRTDLYSLGVILYEGLAGARPFDGQTLAALVIRIHKGECAPLHEVAPHAPRALCDLVMRAMSPDRAARFASSREMLAALLPFADSSYVAGLDTLREVVADAVTLKSPAVQARVPAAPPLDSGAVTLDAMADAARRSRSPGQTARVRAIAAAVAVVVGLTGALAWALSGEGEPQAVAPVASPPASYESPDTMALAPPEPEPAAAAEPLAATDPSAEPAGAEPVEAATASVQVDTPPRPRTSGERSSRTSGEPAHRSGRRPGRSIERENPY